MNIQRALIYLSFAMLPGAAAAQAADAPASPTKPTVQMIDFGRAPIFVSSRVSLAEAEVARDLADILKRAAVHKINWPALGVFSVDKLPAGKTGVIVIGTPESELVKPHLHALGVSAQVALDQIACKVIDGNLYLAGNRPRAAMYAVYNWLRDKGGGYHLWEGGDGEFFTKYPGSAFRLPEDYAFTFTCPFKYRMFTKGLHGMRSTFNFNDPQFDGERCVGFEMVTPFRSQFQEHPEYFAVKDGKPYLPPNEGWSWIINGCYSNEGFFQMVLERARKIIRDQQITVLTAAPSDGGAFCSCPDCEKTKKSLPDLSSWWHQYADRLNRELKREFPGVAYGAAAYQFYKAVPGIPIKEASFAWYCQYDRCFVHKLSNTNCLRNSTSKAHIQAWIDQQKLPLGVYGYDFDSLDFKPNLDLPIWEFLVDAVQYYRDQKMMFVYTETGRAGDGRSSRLAAYAYGRICWDPTLTSAQIVNEYCKAAYGPASTVMIHYCTALAAAWEMMPVHLADCFSEPRGIAKHYLSPEIIRMADETFLKASNAVARLNDKESMKPRYFANLQFEQAGFKRWQALYEQAVAESVDIILVRGTGDDDFANGVKLQPWTVGKWQPAIEPNRRTEAVGYWTDGGLHLRITCFENDMKRDKGRTYTNEDVSICSSVDALELFIQPPGSSVYYQFMMNRQGNLYDAKVLDNSWNSGWTCTTRDEADKWVATLKIPLDKFGATPHPDVPWQLMIIRTLPRYDGKVGALAQGFPGPFYHQMGNAANITFGMKQPNK